MEETKRERHSLLWQGTGEEFLSQAKRERIKEQYVDAKRRLREYDFELHTGVPQERPTSRGITTASGGRDATTQKERLYTENQKLSQSLQKLKKELETQEEAHARRVQRLDNEIATIGGRLERFQAADPTIKELVKGRTYKLSDGLEPSDTQPLVNSLRVALMALLSSRGQIVELHRLAVSRQMNTSVRNLARTVELIRHQKDREAAQMNDDPIFAAVAGTSQYWKNQYQNAVFEASFLREEHATTVGERCASDEVLARIQVLKEALSQKLSSTRTAVEILEDSVRREQLVKDYDSPGKEIIGIEESFNEKEDKDENVHISVDSPSEVMKSVLATLRARLRRLIRLQKANIRMLKASYVRLEQLNIPKTVQIHEVVTRLIATCDVPLALSSTDVLPRRLALFPEGDPIQVLREREKFLIALCDACVGGQRIKVQPTHGVLMTTDELIREMDRS